MYLNVSDPFFFPAHPECPSKRTVWVKMFGHFWCDLAEVVEKCCKNAEIIIVVLQSLAAHSRDTARSDVADGPPPFIPFAQRGKVENTSRKGTLANF